MKNNLANSALNRRRSRRTVLQVAEDLERADRIKRLKLERRLKWREVADAVHVSERAVMEWAKNGTINEEHSDALAAYLEVDPNWLWKGPAQQSPDLMSALAGPDLILNRFDALDAKIDHLADLLVDLQISVATRRKRKPSSGSAAAGDG